MKNYGFWIIPQQSLYQEIELIINNYHQRYQAPIFTPHMTLHGVVSSTDDQVVEVVEKAAHQIKPFALEVGEVEFSSTYFQCVFARVKTNADLFNTHMALRNGFSVEEKHVFMPHLSLVYGDFSMEERQKIINEINIENKSFKAEAITIIRADSPDPKTWEVVKQVAL